MGPGFLTAAPSNNQQQPANETTFGQTALEQARALARHQLAQAGVVAGALTPSSIPPQPHMSQNNPQQTMSAPPAPSSQSMSMSMSQQQQQQQQQQYKSDLDPRPSMDPNQGPLTSQQQEERARLAAQGRRPLLGAPAGNVQGGKGGDVSGGGGGGGLTLSHEVLDTITCPLEKMSLLLGNQGSTMQRVTDISGCDVVVNHDLPPGLPRILELRGTERQVRTARTLINSIINGTNGNDNDGNNNNHNNQRSE